MNIMATPINLSHSSRSFVQAFTKMHNKNYSSTPKILQSKLPTFIIKISTQYYCDLK